jgi:hypothetical protein
MRVPECLPSHPLVFGLLRCRPTARLGVLVFLKNDLEENL